MICRIHALAGAIREGDPIVVFNQRGMEFWIDLLAVWALGGVTIPVAVTTDEASMTTMIRVAKPRGYLGNPGIHQEALGGPWPKPSTWSAEQARRFIGRGDGGNSKSRASTPPPGLDRRAEGRPLDPRRAPRQLPGDARGDRRQRPRPGGGADPVQLHELRRPLSRLPLGRGLPHRHRREADAAKPVPSFIQSAQAIPALARAGTPRWISELCEQEPTKIHWLMASGDHLGVDVIEHLEKSLPDTRLLVVYGLTEVGGRCCILDRGKVRAAHPNDPTAVLIVLWNAARR